MFGFFVMYGLTTTVPTERPAPDGPSDGDLIAAAQRGDATAFGTLHARHYKRIYHLAYLKTNNAQDAEDVASETFMRALASLNRFHLKSDPEGVPVSFYPWLHRIALNLIVDSHRQRPPSGVVSLDAPVIAGMRALLDSHLPDGSPSPQEVVERHEVQQLVRAAIAALPPDQGDVLIHRFLGDLTPREIAPLLDRSEPAVKSLLHRATVALKREIERRVEAVERLESGRDRRPITPQSQKKETQKEETQYVGRN